MSLEELWELFPIVLVAHDSRWHIWAQEEMELLSALLVDFRPTATHIGSTAIPSIMAKPTVDILIEVNPDRDWTPIREILESRGYICMSESPGRMSFNKGYTPEGYADRVFHIHVHAHGDNDEIYFRDYLRAHPDSAREYEVLKLSLLPEYQHNRDGYTNAKASFVKHIMATKSQS